MITARLVAPGAMSPISMLPSFKTMWCVTVSLFLNMTCCPPKFAGLGVNACFPFWPTIVIVDAAAAADGAVVLDDPLPPPLQPNAAARPSASTEAFHTLSRIHQSFRELPAVRSFVQDKYRHPLTGISASMLWRLTQAVRGLRESVSADTST